MHTVGRVYAEQNLHTVYCKRFVIGLGVHDWIVHQIKITGNHEIINHIAFIGINHRSSSVK